MATSPANSAARTPSSVHNDYQEFESSEEGEAVPSALEPATKMAEKSSDPQSSDRDASAASLAKQPAEISAENLPSMGLQPAKRSAEKIRSQPAEHPAEKIHSPLSAQQESKGTSRLKILAGQVSESTPAGPSQPRESSPLTAAPSSLKVQRGNPPPSAIGNVKDSVAAPQPATGSEATATQCVPNPNPSESSLLLQSKIDTATADAKATRNSHTALTGSPSSGLAPTVGAMPVSERHVVAELARQVERLASQNAKMARDLQELRKEAEQHHEDSEALILEKEQLLNEVLEQKRLLQTPAPPPKFGPLENPDYHQRFQWLVQKGWSMVEACEALEATKQKDTYSSARADAHLKSISDGEIRSALQAANQQTAAKEEGLQIAENSALAQLLEGHTDAVDIVVKLKTTHANMKARAAHTAKTAVAAGNLVQLPSIQSDSSLARKGQLFLGQVALAVCEDCEKCAEQRDKLAQEELEKTRAKAARDEQEAKKRKLQEEKAAEARKRAAHRPITVNFRAADSKRDVTLPRLPCSTCGKGTEGGKWVYHCTVCKRAYHETCQEITLFRGPGKKKD